MNQNKFTLLSRAATLFAPVVAALLLVLAVAPGMASAHARLTSSVPPDGGTVVQGTTQITMTFAEEISVDQSTASLVDSSGKTVSGTTAAVDRADRTKMTLTTPPLAPGKYTVNYKTVTEDDNGIVNAGFSFTAVDNRSGGLAVSTPTETSSTSASTPTAVTTGGGNSLPATGASDNFGSVAALAFLAAGLLIGVGIYARKRS